MWRQVKAMVTELMRCGHSGEFLIRDKRDETDCYALAVVSERRKLVTFLIGRKRMPSSEDLGQLLVVRLCFALVLSGNLPGRKPTIEQLKPHCSLRVELSASHPPELARPL